MDRMFEKVRVIALQGDVPVRRQVYPVVSLGLRHIVFAVAAVYQG